MSALANLKENKSLRKSLILTVLQLCFAGVVREHNEN